MSRCGVIASHGELMESKGCNLYLFLFTDGLEATIGSGVVRSMRLFASRLVVGGMWLGSPLVYSEI
jgi:hypothetical protein